MYYLWLVGSASLTVKAYWAAEKSNFRGFIIYIFLSNMFTIFARRERE